MSVGGEESFVSNVLKHIDYENLIIDIMCPYSCDDMKAVSLFNQEKNRLRFLNVSYNGNVLKNDIYHPTLSFLKSSQYDAVHIHSCNTSALALISFAAKRAGTKRIIVHSHNTGTKKDFKYFALKASFEPMLLACATDFAACSHLAGEWKYTQRICMNKLVILKNGIDLNVFRVDNEKRNEFRVGLGYSNDDLVIGHVGRFAEQKNHNFIIDVFTSLREKSDKYKLLLIGDGELKDDINQKLSELGLTDSVTMTGNVNNVQEFMQVMDIFILPSLFEGLPITGVEAQSCGLPCVFSDAITREIGITDRVEFVSLKDKTKWVETIEKLILLPKMDNSEMIRAVGYDIEETAKKLEEMYLCG